MTDLTTIIIISFAGTAALFSLLTFLRAVRSPSEAALTAEQVLPAIANETDQIRKSGDEQARALRQELGENLRGFQETTLKGFRELGEGLGAQVKEFGGRLDTGVKVIDDRAAAIAAKLDQDIKRMGDEATRNRDTLRQAIETKLDDAAAKQATAAKELREEMTGSFRKLGANVADTLSQLGEHQKERLENVTTALSDLSEKHGRAQETSSKRSKAASMLSAPRMPPSWMRCAEPSMKSCNQPWKTGWANPSTAWSSSWNAFIKALVRCNLWRLA